MSQSVSAVTPVEFGLASGFLAAGIGYGIAPRKYNLEQLLTQDSDVFKESVPQKFIKNGSTQQKAAHKKLIETRKILNDIVNADLFDKKLSEFIKKTELQNAYTSIKKFIPRARIETALISGIVTAIAVTACKALFGSSKN